MCSVSVIPLTTVTLICWPRDVYDVWLCVSWDDYQCNSFWVDFQKVPKCAQLSLPEHLDDRANASSPEQHTWIKKKSNNRFWVWIFKESVDMSRLFIDSGPVGSALPLHGGTKCQLPIRSTSDPPKTARGTGNEYPMTWNGLQRMKQDLNQWESILSYNISTGRSKVIQKTPAMQSPLLDIPGPYTHAWWRTHNKQNTENPNTINRPCGFQMFSDS